MALLTTIALCVLLTELLYRALHAIGALDTIPPYRQGPPCGWRDNMRKARRYAYAAAEQVNRPRR